MPSAVKSSVLAIRVKRRFPVFFQASPDRTHENFLHRWPPKTVFSQLTARR